MRDYGNIQWRHHLVRKCNHSIHRCECVYSLSLSLSLSVNLLTLIRTLILNPHRSRYVLSLSSHCFFYSHSISISISLSLSLINSPEGYVVHHNRNPGLSSSGSRSSQILSRVVIQEGAKWQFCNTTQVPFCFALNRCAM